MPLSPPTSLRRASVHVCGRYGSREGKEAAPERQRVCLGCAGWDAMTTRLVVDRRERQLVRQLGADAIDVQTLDFGDVLCAYPDGAGWVAERKTSQDLAASLIDGRWHEQKDR